MSATKERRESDWKFHWCVPLRLFVSFVYTYIFYMALRFNSCLSLWKSPLLPKSLSFSNSSCEHSIQSGDDEGTISRYKPHHTTHHTIVYDGWGLSHSQIVNVWGLFCIIYFFSFILVRSTRREEERKNLMDGCFNNDLNKNGERNECVWAKMSCCCCTHSIVELHAKLFISVAWRRRENELNKIYAVMKSAKFCCAEYRMCSNFSRQISSLGFFFVLLVCCSSIPCYCCCNWFFLNATSPIISLKHLLRCALTGR